MSLSFTTLLMVSLRAKFLDHFCKNHTISQSISLTGKSPSWDNSKDAVQPLMTMKMPLKKKKVNGNQEITFIG